MTFVGEAKLDGSFETTVGSGRVFRLIYGRRGLTMALIGNANRNEIDAKDRFVDAVTLNRTAIGDVWSFTFNTISLDGAEAAEIILGEMSSEDERRAARTELNKAYRGQGRLRILDMKRQMAPSENMNSVSGVHFEGELDIPIRSARFCAK